MAWIDIGVNLTDSSFQKDLGEVVARGQAAGVTRMIVTGTSVERSRAAAELCEAFPGVLWCTAGVHPHDAKSCTDRTIDELRQLAQRPEVAALGECGLDFNRNFSPPKDQRRWFEAQLELADELQMPVFVHERDASEEMISTLERWRSRLTHVVIHCFTGDGDALRRYIDLDLYIGITGWICDERRGLPLRELVPLIPSNRLMLETDAPYLLPRTIKPRPKSRRNEPAYLLHVARTVAECRGVELASLEHSTTDAAMTFFGLPTGD